MKSSTIFFPQSCIFTEIQKNIFSTIIHTFQSFTNTALLLLSEIFDSKWSIMGWWHDLVDILHKAFKDWFSPQFVFSEISHFLGGKRSGHALQLNRTL